MPAVAEVQFKAVNAQQVEGAFKSIGNSAQASSTKIQQNSNAMKSLGQGMKSSVGGIAQVGTAFATLSLSVVSTWRAYRDLGDAQLAVDRANTKLTKSEEKLNDLKKKATTLQKEMGKGGKEDEKQRLKVKVAQDKLNKAIKEHTITQTEAKLQQMEINEMMSEGSDVGGKLAEVQKDIAIQEEVVANNTFAASEAQERYNDTQQDFYLSILPTALSGLSTLSLSLNGIKNMFAGGGGLLGGFGAFGIAIAGIGAAILAFKTNFLGFRDIVMGVINFVREQFGAWKQTIQEVFGLIQKGDWGGAFARIAKAAQDFWTYLVTHVPFFGGLNKIIVALKNGDWAGVFAIIQQAAVKWWADMKKAVPFLADIENFIISLSNADWSGMWKAVLSGWQNSGLPQMVENFFGTNWKEGLDAKFGEISGLWGLLAKSITDQDWKATFSVITDGMKASGLQEVMDKLITPTVTITVDWVTTLINSIADGINTFADAAVAASSAPASMDTVWTKVISGVDWAAHAGSMVYNLFAGIGLYLTSQFLGPIGKIMESSLRVTFAGQRMLAVATNVGIDIANAIAVGISQANPILKIAQTLITDPKTKAVYEQMLKQAPIGHVPVPTFDEAEIDKTVKDEMTKLYTYFNKQPKPKIGVTGDTTTLETAVSQTIKNINGTSANIPVGMDGTKLQTSLQDQLGKVKGMDPAKLPIDLNTAPAQKTLGTTKTKINTSSPAKMPTELDTRKALQQEAKLVQHIQSQKPVITVRVVPQIQGNIKGQIAKTMSSARGPQARVFGFGQHGINTTVKRPTMLFVGEGGRYEDVRVTPRGSRGGGGGSGGDRDIYIGPIYLAGEKIMDIIRYKINENQAVVK